MYIRTTDITNDKLGPWKDKVFGFDLIAGYSLFGTIFLLNSETQEIGILLPLDNDFVPTGIFTWEEFEKHILSNSEFIGAVLRPDDINKLEGTLGRVGESEVYFPVPYPFMGGSSSLDTYDKGDIWIFLSITGQSWGI